MPLDNKISNIIGAKLPQWVLNQLDTRSVQNTKDFRDNNNILYLANKSAWVRLVSSINVTDKEDQNYFKTTLGVNIQDETTLAKEFVLFGGTSKYLNKNSYQLRSGIGKDGAYGTLGDEEIKKYGYKPMPGITNVNIETQGRLGSLRAATVNFKCWDKSQLDIIDALYFKLGYTMFLEWGHTYFYPSFENNQKVDPNKIQSTELYSIDPFQPGLTKERVFYQIAQNSRQAEGNYDAMLGMVTNFNFTYTQDGGYDCTLRLVSLGILGDSIKINNAPTLPNLLQEEITKYNNTLARIEKARQDAEAAKNGLISGTNINGDPRSITSYSSCIQNLPGVKIADVYKSKSLRKDERVSNYAANAIFEGEDLYFYLDGQYQTTGFSKSGRWECLDGQLVLDGITSILSYLNKQVNKKNSEPNLSDLGKIVSSAGYAGSKTISIDDYNYLTEIPNRGWSLLFPRFGAILPTDNTSGFILSITIDNNYLFEKVSNFLQYKPNVQNGVGPQGLPTLPGTSIPSAQSTIQTAQSIINTLEFSMFNAKSITNDPELIRLDIDYFGANTKKYYTSLRVEFSRTNPNFKKEILNRQAVYEAAISKFRSSQTVEFTSIAFETRTITETYGATVRPFGTVSENNTNSISRRYPVIKLSTTINVSVKGIVLDTSPGTEGTIQKQYQGDIIIPVSVDLYTTDTDLITSIKKGSSSPNYLKTQKDLSDQNQVQNTNTSQENPGQSTDPTQTKQAITSQSALELILRAIEVRALETAITKENNSLDIGRKVYHYELHKETNFLKSLFSTGIMSSFITKLVSNSIPDSQYVNGTDLQRFEVAAKYGFATSLLGNKEELADLKPNNYTETLNAYVIPYEVNQEIQKGTNIIHPVYIPFSLLLMVLNHSCTIYDTNKTTNFQTPLVYIDYNNNLNFFLSNAQQLSTNPFVTMIPYEGTSQDFKALFDPSILDGSSIRAISGSTETMPIFDTQKDALSKSILKVKSGGNSSVYRGKTMNILLNVEYLIKLIQDYSYKDGSNNVYLKPFLEQILFDINKYLGDFNSFRLSYNDQANTFQIVDDQFIPSPFANEVQIQPNQRQASITNRTEIPLFGKSSIAKSLEIKTDISSRLANMIAISSNSTVENKSTLSTNGDSVGYINTSFIDRYIPDKLEVTGSTSTKQSDTLKISARHFNQTIKDFYSTVNPSEANVSDATNYYIEKMTKVKNDNLPTRASTLIPVSINFTTDGISGLGMGQAFTVNDELLPYTYTTKKIAGMPKDYINNIGFVMVGLNHTIDANAWNTTVRANMIFLKDKTLFNVTASAPNSPVNEFGFNPNNNGVVYNTQTFYIAKGPEAKKSAETYLGRTMTDVEWSQLVAATFAEASSNQTERAWVMAVILNRTRTKYLGAQSITDTLTRQNQFQAVTGTSANGRMPSSNYTNGPDSSSEESIYGAAVQILTNVPKNYLFFTSNNPKAYGPGTDITFLDRLKNIPGSKIIGMTVFSTTS